MTDNSPHVDFGRTFQLDRPATGTTGQVVPMIETEPSETESTWSLLFQLRNSLAAGDLIDIAIDWWVGQAQFTKKRRLSVQSTLSAIRTAVTGRKIRVSAQFIAGPLASPPAPPAILLAAGASPDAPILGQQFYMPHWVNGTVTGPNQDIAPTAGPGVMTDALIDITAVPGAGPFFILFVDKPPTVPPVNGDLPIAGGTSRAITAAPDSVAFEGFGDDFLEFSKGLWVVSSTTPDVVTLTAGMSYYPQVRIGS